MPVRRNVQSRIVKPETKVAVFEKDQPAPPSASDRQSRDGSLGGPKVEKKEQQVDRNQARTKKVCQFCTSKTTPRYWDIVVLRKYLNDRGRIVGRNRFGACARHQRSISREIKRARHLSLLPFLVKV